MLWDSSKLLRMHPTKAFGMVTIQVTMSKSGTCDHVFSLEKDHCLEIKNTKSKLRLYGTWRTFLTFIFTDLDFLENDRIHIQTFLVFLLSTTSDGEKRSTPVNPKILQICILEVTGITLIILSVYMIQMLETSTNKVKFQNLSFLHSYAFIKRFSYYFK